MSDMQSGTCIWQLLGVMNVKERVNKKIHSHLQPASSTTSNRFGLSLPSSVDTVSVASVIRPGHAQITQSIAKLILVLACLDQFADRPYQKGCGETDDQSYG